MIGCQLFVYVIHPIFLLFIFNLNLYIQIPTLKVLARYYFIHKFVYFLHKGAFSYEEFVYKYYNVNIKVSLWILSINRVYLFQKIYMQALIHELKVVRSRTYFLNKSKYQTPNKYKFFQVNKYSAGVIVCFYYLYVYLTSNKIIQFQL